MTGVSPWPNRIREEQGPGHPIPGTMFGGMGGDALRESTQAAITVKLHLGSYPEDTLVAFPCNTRTCEPSGEGAAASSLLATDFKSCP